MNAGTVANLIDVSGPAAPSETRTRTLLHALVQGRHLTRPKTVDLLQARAEEMGITDFTVSLRQLDRWFAGQVATLPRPSVCRVIEAEFGYPIDVLLAPETEVPIPASLHQPPEKTDRTLRTVEFVSWIADQSNLAFDAVYVAVSEMADRLAAEPVSQRAGREHARAAVSRGQIAEAVQR
jgi:hypothetical protein